MEYHIVLVDDDSLSLTIAKNILDGENLRVSCLRSGKDLLKFLKIETPDLILLDILMPDMDGFETYHEVRKYEKMAGKPLTPVIFLTGETGIEIERRSFKTGASDFVRKPLNKDVLLSRIRNTIINNKTIENLTEEATVDKLTGFLNKVSGNRKVAELCNERTGALAVCDLDSFKLVNDLYGHDMGDRTLEAFADVIRRNTREKDVVSRIGGDEFMGFFENLIEEKAVAALCERLNTQMMAEAVKLMGKDFGIPLGISMGIVMVPEHGREFETLFQLADSALYSVKENGRHGYEIYGLRQIDTGTGDGDLEKELERTLKTVEERNETKGAFLLGREAFAAAYRYGLRMCRSRSQAAYHILFDIIAEGKDSEPDMQEISACFSEILTRNLDGCNLILKNKQNQFFVFVPQTEENEVEATVNKVLAAWKETPYYDKTKIGYVTKEVS